MDFAALENEISGHLAKGDHKSAATSAINGLGPQILAFLGAQTRDDDAAYDVFGAFCEQLWKSIPTFRGESSFKTWAYKLVMHSLSRYRRDAFRKRGQPLGTSEASAIAEQVRSRTAPFKRTEVKDGIAKLRDSLDPDDQTLLFLRVDQGLSWNDVAAVLSEQGEAVEVAAIRKRFERAKARLRKLAEEHGILDS
jgi:RNA polymerase sigma-70 factor (ECF subfamily)